MNRRVSLKALIWFGFLSGGCCCFCTPMALYKTRWVRQWPGHCPPEGQRSHSLYFILQLIVILQPFGGSCHTRDREQDRIAPSAWTAKRVRSSIARSAICTCVHSTCFLPCLWFDPTGPPAVIGVNPVGFTRAFKTKPGFCRLSAVTLRRHGWWTSAHLNHAGIHRSGY